MLLFFLLKFILLFKSQISKTAPIIDFFLRFAWFLNIFMCMAAKFSIDAILLGGDIEHKNIFADEQTAKLV